MIQESRSTTLDNCSARSLTYRGHGHLLASGVLYGAVFIGVFALYSNVYFGKDLRPLQGDEPHYLLTTISILDDGDVNLRNQYDEKQWREFLPYELPDEHCGPQPPADVCLPNHNLWFSGLLVPFYAWGGVVGVTRFLLLMSAAIPVLMIRLLDSLTPRPFWPGRILAVVLAFAAPITGASGTLYPSLLGAVLILTGMILFVEATRRQRPSLLVVSAIPFALTGVFHHAFILLAAGYLLCLVVMLGRRIPKGVFLIYAVIYGVWVAVPYALGGDVMTGTAAGGFTPEYLRSMVSFHLLDLVHGLLTNAPVVLFYLVSWPVIFGIRARLPRFALQFLFAANAMIGITLISYCFNGITPGESSISRYFVPVIPLALVTVLYLGYHSLAWLLALTAAAGLSAVVGAMVLTTGCRVTSCHVWIEDELHGMLGGLNPLQIAGSFQSWSLVAGYLTSLSMNVVVPWIILLLRSESSPLVQESVGAAASAG